ncbi:MULTISPECIES: transcription termination/antitermination protein NusG [Sediminispirochaeta]|jgi:transcriptional antiterminator NusG|uniref:Transcription termination/antitermination protein NusG n=1 Tax=Sediminispirochaeta smaragdinae (strain DSM 11293 / JCM 15392 / SEBR 4228) TaxID=573413 RepID=E1RCJ8_SEDSS|nr:MULTISPECIES: transcription termination/antitermination protein NusG [Sediminispirochaeta]ADK80078.1 NusG antitermination factor [Sediminispirochaeta smaragdinae DSM 11293]
MAKGWYVLHTYSGYENKIERFLRKMMGDGDFGDALTDVKVPSEEVVEVKDGKKKVTNRKFLPGYILLEMDLPDRGWKAVCSQIKKIQGVTGFVGAPVGAKPQPISSDEAKAILQKSGEIKADRTVRPRQSFSVGEVVRIVDGPFDTFTGNIEEVNLEKGKLRVMVGIFGRSTPVEVDFLQVEKI